MTKKQPVTWHGNYEVGNCCGLGSISNSCTYSISFIFSFWAFLFKHDKNFIWTRVIRNLLAFLPLLLPHHWKMLHFLFLPIFGLLRCGSSRTHSVCFNHLIWWQQVDKDLLWSINSLKSCKIIDNTNLFYLMMSYLMPDWPPALWFWLLY